MLKFKDFEMLNEKVQVSLPNRVNLLISSLINIEPRISKDPWPEKIKKEGSNDTFMGLRMYLGDILFRVNWKDGMSEPVMIDIWDSKAKNDPMPKVSIIGNYEIFRLASSMILDMISALSSGRHVMASTKKQFNKSSITESSSPENNPKIVPAPPEETDDTMQPSSDFEGDDMDVFDELRSLVIMVINQINPSLLVTGRGGIGKTHTVMSTLNEFGLVKNEEYVVIKGAATPLSMYKALYQNNGKIVIFDDCDSIFKDPDGVNILKGALDSYDEREISWLSKSTYDPETQSPSESKPVPNRFVFDGGIIFISNLPMEKVDQAVRTRSYVIDISLSEEEIFDIMEKNLPNILPTVDLSTKKEVLSFLRSEYSSSNETISIRTLIKAIKIRLSGAPNWKRLASKYA